MEHTILRRCTSVGGIKTRYGVGKDCGGGIQTAGIRNDGQAHEDK